jgi:hypothetical protein
MTESHTGTGRLTHNKSQLLWRERNQLLRIVLAEESLTTTGISSPESKLEESLRQQWQNTLILDAQLTDIGTTKTVIAITGLRSETDNQNLARIIREGYRHLATAQLDYSPSAVA